MDEIVMAALRKWPNVPHCFGWLALDARGDWYLRDDVVQHVGPFPQVKGSRIEHEKLLDFIGRNYGHDDAGAWFFQNGPQRVYVELEAAPWVWRLGGDGAVTSHTGLPTNARSAWTDTPGRLFLDTDLGFGIVHTMDTGIAADTIDAGRWQPQALDFDAMPQRFGYRLRPAVAG